jgi:iron complex outermembrane receptor protein
MQLFAKETRVLLLTGASFIGLSSTSHAQEAAASGGVGVAEIVVTATRRDESINRVPISISAMSQETLDIKGVKSIEEVSRFTPGLRFDLGNNRVIIRGIASNAGAGTTGIYIDETPIQMRTLRYGADDAVPAVFDLERVEVLRGPQGTLFGAGSQGGTVRYITPAPSLTDRSVYARGELSSTAHGGMGYEFGAATGGPIVEDSVGFRASAYHRRTAGWIERVDNKTGRIVESNNNTTETTALAASLAFAPAENVLITPSIRYQRRQVDDLGMYYVALSDPGRGIFKNSSPTPRNGWDKFYLADVTAKVELSSFDVISNTSYYRRRNAANGYDGTIYNLGILQFSLPCAGCNNAVNPLVTPTGANKALPYYLAVGQVSNNQTNFTQEVRLQSNATDSRLNWVAGLFYQKAKQYSNDLLYNPDPDPLMRFVFNQSYEQFFGMPLYNGAYDYDAPLRSNESQIAGFASATFDLTEQLKVTAGMRYARMKYAFTSSGDGTANGGHSESSGKSNANPFSPRVNITYEIDDANMVYATYAKGFRAGGANEPLPTTACAADLAILGISSSPDTFKSDQVTSFELGSKNRLFEGRLQVAGSVYNVNWSGIQQTVTLPT